MNKDNTPLEFGKFKGETPEEIAEHSPDYIVWLHDNVKPTRCSRALRREAEQYMDEGRFDWADGSE